MYTGAGNDKSTFVDAFKLPFAGDRVSSDAKMFSTGVYADLWSASPDGGEGAEYISVSDRNARVNYYYRASALPVRCFANSSSPSSSDLSATTEIILTIEE